MRTLGSILLLVILQIPQQADCQYVVGYKVQTTYDTTDIVRPAPVVLVCDSTGDEVIYLRWAATGDDSLVGTASSYDIRYSTRSLSLGELFSNPSFASNVSGWSVYGSGAISWETGVYRTASGSLKLTNAGDPYMGAYATVTTSSTDSVIFMVYLRSTVSCDIDAWVMDQSDNLIGALQPFYIPSGGWTAVTVRRKLTGSQTSIKLGFNWNPGASGNILYADDASCTIGREFSFFSQATGEPAPLVSGTSQTFTLVGMTNGIQYYIAMTATDEAGNVSAVSNAVTGTPVAPSPISDTSGYHVTVSAVGSGNGSYSNPWTLEQANLNLTAGDTVYIHAGTYTGTTISPTNPGSSGLPIVYKNYESDVCSLYVGTPSINLNKDYVIVQGLRVRASNATNEMTVQSATHTAIIDCYLYSYPSTTASWETWHVTGNYSRFIGNVCNGGETSRDADEDRHEGLVLGGVAKYCVLEGNTVSRITHYAIAVQGGPSPGPSWNSIRNNTAFDSHVNLGQNYWNKNNLYEGNRTYSGGQMLSYRPGISYEGSANQSIVRFNMIYNDSVDQNATGGRKPQMSEILTQSSGTIDYDNRLYGNAFVGLSRNVAHQTILLTQNDAEPNTMGKSVYVNNILAYANATRGGYCYEYQDNSAGAQKDTFRTNLLWAQTAGDTITKIDYTTRTLAATEAAYPTLWSGNIERVPLWVDSLSLRGSRSFELAAASPCVDAGAALTTVASNVSSSAIVTVGDARYFHYDWGASPYDRGDSLLIGTLRCELDSVDYTNRRLILKAAISVSAGAEVHVLATWSTSSSAYISRLKGSAPDIGPYELP